MSWTDERLDDLSQKVDRGFERTEAAVERCNASIRDLRADMDRGFERVNADINVLRAEMGTRFDALHRTLFLGATGVIASLIGLIATQL